MSDLKQNAIIGAAKPRVDGPKKVSGQAKYAADHAIPNLVFGYGVFSTVANGKISRIDTTKASQIPGVIAIFHHKNFPRLYRTPNSMEQKNHVDEPRLPFEDDRVYYSGQFVALIVADTYEIARAAARMVAVTYSDDETATSDNTVVTSGDKTAASDKKAVTSLDEALKQGKKTKPDDKTAHHRGDPKAAFAAAKHKIDVVYTTPTETHNPIESHATTAVWHDGNLLMFEATQGVIFARNTMAKIFGLPPERVEVRAPFIGSGFGSKLWIWPHAVATAAAAREIGRPVHFVVPRAQMFTTTGHRAPTQQKIRMSTDDAGRLTSLSHHTINTTSEINQVVETAGRCSSSLYTCANVDVSHATVEVNTGTPTAMRAPGAAPGLFALESAMDEMAAQLGMDPLQFRKLNSGDMDESSGLPFSSKHLIEAFDRGAEKFGWSRRNPKIGSMRDGDEIIGWGVAACNWEALKAECEARVSLRADGTVLASCATQDIGTGTYTVIAQTVSATTGVPVERIEVEIGASRYSAGPLSGGSWATASVMPAVAQAAKNAIDELKTYATADDGVFSGEDPKSIGVENGKLRGPENRSVSYADILKAKKVASADGVAKTSGESDKKYSYKSFGVHFVEVRWDPGISRLRIARVVSAIDAGQIVNKITATNQVEGAIVMGIGMALFEHTEYDPRSGRPVNNNLAEYLMPVHADQPTELDVILLDHPDYKFNEFGVRGIGEIGITGLAGAVANAVYHATGKRIRDLPITLDKLMST